MMGNKQTTIRVLEFDGVRSNFRYWYPKFLAKAGRYKYKSILTGESALPPVSEYDVAVAIPKATRNADQTSIVERYELGSYAYDDLLLSMNSSTPSGIVAFGIVDGCKTVSNPDGDARLAWTRLNAKYAPTNAPSYIVLENKFANSSLTSCDKDPEKFIMELEALRTEMNKVRIPGKSEKTETDMILHILANVPEEYEMVVQSLQRNVGLDPSTNPNATTITKVREELTLRYDRLKKHRRQSNIPDGDRAMMAAIQNGMDEMVLAAFLKQFKGLCNNCGKYGHKGADCKKKSGSSGGDTNNNNNNGGTKRFRGNCFHCGINGHKKQDCYKLKQSKEHAKLLLEGDTEPEMSDNESFDELGFLMGAREVSVPDQHVPPSQGTASTAGTSRKRVTFSDQAALISYENGEDTSGTSIKEVPTSFRPKKRLKNNEGKWAVMQYEAVDSLMTDLAVSSSDEETDARGPDDVCLMAGVPLRSMPHTSRPKKTASVSWAMSCKSDNTSDTSFTNETWYGDSGSTCHLDNSDTGMFDVTNICDTVGVVGGHSIIATKVGKKRYSVRQVDGTRTEKVLDRVKFCAEAREKLFSITYEMSKGAGLSSDSSKNIILSYPDGSQIVCDRRMNVKGGGFVNGVEMVPVSDFSNLAHDKAWKDAHETELISVNDYHEQLGHPSMVITRSTAKARGVELKGTAELCRDCSIGKAKQKKVPKDTVERSSIPGERLFLDISHPKTNSLGCKRNWLLVLDDATDCPFSFFMSHKDLLSANLVPFIKDLRDTYGIKVKIIRCDNAGENLAFEEACKREGLGLRFEYTAPGTPQQNGRVEKRFQTLYGRARAMLLGSGIDKPLRVKLWPEAANTATDLDSILVRNGESLSPSQKFFGKDRKSHIDIDSNTKKFGEECIVADRTKIKGKFADRGKPCFWLGYAKNHAAGTYRLLNCKTNRIIQSRDVIFTRKNSTQVLSTIVEEVTVPMSQMGNDDEDEDTESDDEDEIPHMIPEVSDSDESSTEESDDESSHGEDSEDETLSDADTLEDTATLAENPKVVAAMKKLSSSFNPDASKIVRASRRSLSGTGREEADSVSTSDVSRYLCEKACMLSDTEKTSSVISLSYKEPKSFEEAWNHPDPVQRARWRKAVLKEFGDMESRKVWKKMKRKDMPKNRRCVKSRWVFKIKRDGTFRARLVACGYSQIPGVDFTDNYSPVVNDMSFRILLLIKMLYGLDGLIADVETAFLEGKLEEEIFMECPKGMKGVSDDDILSLTACIYGLVQASRQYYKRFAAVLRKIGFTGGDVDPCIFMKQSKLGKCYIATYVDDNLIIGHKKAIEDAVCQIRKEGLVLKIENDFHDYLSCEIVFSPDKNRAWLGQPHLIANLEEKFGKQVEGLRKFMTPGTPSLNMIREEDTQLCLSKEMSSLYRSGVGMLLYLVKHSRPDIANAVRQLSKVLDGSTEASYKEMLRVIKYVLDTKTLGLKFEPTMTKGEPWDIVVYTDSDYASDPVSRRSVSGYIIYVHGVPICWKSKAQQSVTLSSTEAEWVALSEAIKEVIFLINLLGSMRIIVQLPVIVRVDNVGAIFMSENLTTTSRTKHIDIRSKYVREYVEDGVIKIIFVKSEDNDSDLLTKNLGSELHHKHSDKLIMKK